MPENTMMPGSDALELARDSVKSLLVLADAAYVALPDELAGKHLADARRARRWAEGFLAATAQRNPVMVSGEVEREGYIAGSALRETCVQRDRFRTTLLHTRAGR